jgi:uncharacterized surface protein with fasciclin (FAS1) repeats
MRKIVYPLFVAGALFLAACGGEKKAEATAEATDSTVTASTEETAPAPEASAVEAAPAAEASAPATSSSTPAASKAKKSAPAAAPTKKIIGTATDLGRFSELANAMTATGLGQILGEDGPFVIFAPNDEAFAKIDPAQKAIFFKPENKQKLINVMKLHVTKGRSTIESLEGTKVVTFNGKLLPIKKTASGFTVGKANVVKANIAATNGMIHEIDAVLLPADY